MALWFTGTNANLWRLNPGGRLRKGDSLRSTDGRFELVLQSDGNLVLYCLGIGALWDTRTPGRDVNDVIMQGDGNLVMYGPSGAIWNSATDNNPGAFLSLQNDGNLVIYRDTTALWHTGTDIERQFVEIFDQMPETFLQSACAECGIQVTVYAGVGAVGGAKAAAIAAGAKAASSKECRECLLKKAEDFSRAMDEAAKNVHEAAVKQQKIEEAREAREFLDRIDRSSHDCDRWERNRERIERTA